jgi:hypothetical protein
MSAFFLSPVRETDRLAFVIAGLVPAISLRRIMCSPDRDGRDKPGHDDAEKRS